LAGKNLSNIKVELGDATTLNLNGKTISGTFSIAQHILKAASLESLLGGSEEEKTIVFQFGLEAEKKWVDAFASDRGSSIAVINS
jgi:hypothetical protein